MFFTANSAPRTVGDRRHIHHLDLRWAGSGVVPPIVARTNLRRGFRVAFTFGFHPRPMVWGCGRVDDGWNSMRRSHAVSTRHNCGRWIRAAAQLASCVFSACGDRHYAAGVVVGLMRNGVGSMLA